MYIFVLLFLVSQFMILRFLLGDDTSLNREALLYGISAFFIACVLGSVLKLFPYSTGLVAIVEELSKYSMMLLLWRINKDAKLRNKTLAGGLMGFVFALIPVIFSITQGYFSLQDMTEALLTSFTHINAGIMMAYYSCSEEKRYNAFLIPCLFQLAFSLTINKSMIAAIGVFLILAVLSKSKLKDAIKRDAIQNSQKQYDLILQNIGE